MVEKKNSGIRFQWDDTGYVELYGVSIVMGDFDGEKHENLRRQRIGGGWYLSQGEILLIPKK